MLQVAWKSWEELSDQYVTRLLKYVGSPSTHHYLLSPFLLPRNGLWFRLLLPSGGSENKSTQRRIHSKLQEVGVGVGWESESLTTSNRSWALTEHPHPYQPLTSASNKIPNSSSALQRPLSPSLSPDIAACKQVCTFNVNKDGLPQIKRKDLERTLLLVLSLSCLGLPTLAENNPTLFLDPQTAIFSLKTLLYWYFFTMCMYLFYFFNKQ